LLGDGFADFRFHDLWHTRVLARQAGTGCDGLKDLGGWKSRVMADRYAKLTTEHLAVAESRVESAGADANVMFPSRFSHSGQRKRGWLLANLFFCLAPRARQSWALVGSLEVALTFGVSRARLRASAARHC